MKAVVALGIVLAAFLAGLGIVLSAEPLEALDFTERLLTQQHRARIGPGDGDEL